MKIKVVFSKTIFKGEKKKRVIQTIIGRKLTCSYEHGNGLVVEADDKAIYNIPSKNVISIKDIKHDE